MSHIAVFFGTTTVALVFCDVLQWRDIKPLQYICFSSVNLDIAALQNPATINISFCANTIAVVQKTATICKLQRRWDDRRNRYSFLYAFSQLQQWVGPPQQTFKFSNPKISFCFFRLPTYQFSLFTFPTYHFPVQTLTSTKLLLLTPSPLLPPHVLAITFSLPPKVLVSRYRVIPIYKFLFLFFFC